MTALRIAAARTRLVSPVPVAGERLARWEAEFRELDGEALARRWVGPDEWLLIRRLQVATRWRADEPDALVGLAWGQALEQAIAESLARGDGHCLRYRDRREAVADLVYRSSLQDTQRQWAWQRMGLLPREGLSADEALHHALRELARQPEGVWPLLLHLLAAEEATAAFTAALRALGGSLVPTLLRLSPRSAPYLNLPAGTAPQTERTTDDAAPRRSEPPAAPALLRWARQRPLLAQRHREAIAPLLAALLWPAPGTPAPQLTERLRQAQARLAGALPPLAPPNPAVRSTTLARDAQVPASPGPGPVISDAWPVTVTAPADLPALPPAMADLASEPTAWGGALFWLTRCGAAWQALADQGSAPELAAWLCATALALGVPASDPALRAFCGGELPPDEPDPAVRAQALTLVQGWEAWLAEAAPDLAPPRVQTVCQRPGRLQFEPGWITLQLPLTAVDTAIRRLALDLDPGWLPWLGGVVRIAYVD